MIERATSVKVNVLDLSSVVQQAEAFARSKWPNVVSVSTPALGIVQTLEGLYALDLEGIGPRFPVTKAQPLTMIFGVWRRRNSSAGLESYESVSVNLDDEDLACLPVLSTTTLDTFIDSFGARLERNFWAWKSQLEPIALEMAE